jgi:hypothetical protein
MRAATETRSPQGQGVGHAKQEQADRGDRHLYEEHDDEPPSYFESE